MRSAPGDKDAPDPADMQVEFVVLYRPDAGGEQDACSMSVRTSHAIAN